MVKKKPTKRRPLRHRWQKNLKKGERITFEAERRTTIRLDTDREVAIQVDKPRQAVEN